VNFRSPFVRFLLTASGLYLSWYLLYEFYLKANTAFDRVVIDSLVRIAESILSALGYAIEPFAQVDGAWRNHIGVAGTSGVTVGAPCDGIILFALFTVFVLSFPGPWKHRLWFIPTGLVIIHLLNACRVAALAIIVYWNEDWLSFNHDYTFTIIVYAIVLALWWWWIHGFSTLKTTKTTNT
jgi:exosortase family protein XrtF